MLPLNPIIEAVPFRKPSEPDSLVYQCTEPEETHDQARCGHDQDSVRESMTTPFEPDYITKNGLNESAFETYNPLKLGNSSNLSNDDVDCPISGSSRNTYLNIGTSCGDKDDS